MTTISKLRAKQAAKLYREGARLLDLIPLAGRNYKEVRATLVREGVKIRRRGGGLSITPRNREIYDAYYEHEDVTMECVAAKYGMTVQGVSAHVRKVETLIKVEKLLGEEYTRG